MAGEELFLIFLIPAVIVLVIFILLLVAVIRMGAGLQMMGEAMRRPSGSPTVAISFSSIANALSMLAEAAGSPEARAQVNATNNALKEQADALKAQAEALGAVAKQLELGVQWYVHAIQNPEPGKAGKK